MLNQDKINVNQLLTGIISQRQFTKTSVNAYFSYVFQDLVARTVNPLENKINFDIFHSYINLPYFFTTKLFPLFSSDEQSITKEEFLDTIYELYFSDIDTKVKFFFKFFDISKNGSIYISDIVLTLKQFHIMQGKADLSLLMKVVNSNLFIKNTLNKDSLNLSEWSKMITFNSDLFVLLVFNFFYFKPFSFDNVKVVANLVVEDKKKYDKAILLIDNIADSTDLLFNYINKNFDKNFEFIEDYLSGDDDELNYLEIFDHDKEKAMHDLRLENGSRKSIHNKVFQTQVSLTTINSQYSPRKPTCKASTRFLGDPEESNTATESPKNSSVSEQVKIQRRKFNRQVSSTVKYNEMKLSKLRKQKGLNESTIITSNIAAYLSNPKIDCIYSTQKYSLLKSCLASSKEGSNTNVVCCGKVKRGYITIMNNDLFVYKYKVDGQIRTSKLFRIIYLKNILVSFEENSNFEKENYYQIKMVSNHLSVYKKKIDKNLKDILKPFSFEFYIPNAGRGHEFAMRLQEIVQYKKVQDYYEIAEELFDERTGMVHKGYSKRNCEPVLVKRINKKLLYSKNIRLASWEISNFSFFSNATDKNVNRGIEKFDMYDNIFLIYEFPTEGVLPFYIKKNSNINLSFILDLIIQVVKGIQYFHTFGVTYGNSFSDHLFAFKDHDDTKKIYLKLISYERSVVLFKEEKGRIEKSHCKTTDKNLPPEVTINQNYCMKSDIWELGIISFFLLFGYLPFEENRYLMIPRKCDFVKEEKDNNPYNILKDLIMKCLTFEVEKRADINEIIELLKPIMEKEK